MVHFQQAICVYLHASVENFRSYMVIQHIEPLLYYRRHSLCGLKLHEISDWRAMASDTHQLFSDTTMCAYTASPYIHHYLVYGLNEYSKIWMQASQPSCILRESHAISSCLTQPRKTTHLSRKMCLRRGCGFNM